jgi:radical SAM superfamily enzyme YgiQ (UPF0313 family)
MKKKIILAIMPVFWPKMPSLGLSYLASFLKSHGIEVDILDLNNFFYNIVSFNLKKLWLISSNASFEKEVISIIKNNYPKEYEQIINHLLDYDIVGFSCFSSNLANTLEITKTLKKRKKEIKIILGGPEITRQFFKTYAKFNKEMLTLSDFLIVGEGEKPFLNYITGSFPEKVKIAKFIQLPKLESLTPQYCNLDYNNYPKNDAVQILFSRGCINKCSFCSERLLYKGFRIRPVEDVISEISYYKNKGIKYFIFNDSLINADLKALNFLCDRIISNFGSIPWEAQIYIRKDMDLTLLKKMKRSGCYNLFVGLESGSNTTLKNMHKGFTREEALDFFKKLNTAGLSFGISIIVGFPGETDKDFFEGLDFIIRHKSLIPKIEQANPFTYYDGTALDKNSDWRKNKKSILRFKIFVEEIKKHKIKHTNAFLGNLIEK